MTLKTLRPGVIAAILALTAWGLIDRSLEYSWEYSCSTDTECEFEDSVREQVSKH